MSQPKNNSYVPKKDWLEHAAECEERLGYHLPPRLVKGPHPTVKGEAVPGGTPCVRRKYHKRPTGK